MSQENVEVVRRVLSAFDAGDREGAFAFADPEIVIDATRNVFNPGTYTGVEGIRRMFAAADETWAELRVEPLEFIDAGDRVVVIGRLMGTGQGSGVEVERFNGQVWTFREGRVSRLEIGFTERSEALEAAEVSE
jgi:ketosteroid isomerase-like protein